MRLTATLDTLLATILVVACRSGPSPRVAEQAAAQSREVVGRYDSVSAQLARSVAFMAAPLRTLNAEQQASVAALLVITRAAAEAQTLQRAPHGGPLEAIWTELPAICPPIRAVSFSRGGCLDADLAYASAMAKCLKDGKTEDRCEFLSSPELGAAVMCRMRALEALAGKISALPGRAWPPEPFPWPIQTVMQPGLPGGLPR